MWENRGTRGSRGGIGFLARGWVPSSCEEARHTSYRRVGGGGAGGKRKETRRSFFPCFDEAISRSPLHSSRLSTAQYYFLAMLGP